MSLMRLTLIKCYETLIIFIGETLKITAIDRSQSGIVTGSLFTIIETYSSFEIQYNK